MCLIPGLADGRFLVDDAPLAESRAAGVSRRGLLGGAVKAAGGMIAGASLVAALEQTAAAQAPAVAGALAPTGDALIPLGVSGGPVLSARHAQPGMALVVNGTTYLVDVGGDTLPQLTAAGLGVDRVAHAFLTHYHSDHIAGYPALAILGWVQARPFPRLDVWGPPPLRRMQAGLMDFFAVDIPSRVYQGSRPLDEVVHAHQVQLGRTAIKPVFRDGNVAVSAVRVQHGPDIKDAYAYRFDIPRDGTSVVFSGDTVPSDNLVRLAQDADILVHEVLSVAGVDAVMRYVDPKVRADLRRHIVESHTKSTDLPAIAKRANVKRLVLHHYVGGILPSEAIAAEVRAAAATAGYGGEIIAATELSPIPLQRHP